MTMNTDITNSIFRQNEAARDWMSHSSTSSYSCVLILIRALRLGWSTNSFSLTSTDSFEPSSQRLDGDARTEK